MSVSFINPAAAIINTAAAMQIDDSIPTTSRASGVMRPDPLPDIARESESRKVPMTCRYFLRGMCRFGPLCHFSHDASGTDDVSGETDAAVADRPSCSTVTTDGPSTSRCRNWANAPVFVPNRQKLTNDDNNAEAGGSHSWAEIVGGGKNYDAANHMHNTEAAEGCEELCPYENPCPYGQCCSYALHFELCDMCDQYCLHPNDLEQRRNHNKHCLQQHEQAMELSFAIARSKDKQCGICFDTIMEKSGREKRFGILPNCSHIFCLECIRKWRQAKQFEHKITRSCPECRVSSDFVCPSIFWVDTKEEKERLLNDYRSALGIKDCKYFKKGEGKCPFGNKCFYRHALPNGDVIDVGCPKRSRKLHSGLETGLIDLLDIYLWDYVDQRDYHWLELLSNGDDSDDNNSDWSDNQNILDL